MPETKQKDLSKVEDCCNANKVKLNGGKCYTLPIKQEECVKHAFTLNSKQLSETNEQKDLGLTMTSKLSWKPNVDNRFNKPWKAFFFLIGKVSSPAAKNTKLNAHVEYVILAIS